MILRAPGLTIADAARPRIHPLLWDAGLVVAFGTLMAAFARLAFYLPFTPVPVSVQTLGVLLTGALLGSRRGALAMLVYLAEGLVGLPVFAAGQSAWSASIAGVPVIVGPSAGYLFSYPIAAFLIGVLAERGWDRAFWRTALAMLAGEAAIYAIALPWLALYVGLGHALPLGLLPFIPGDVAKLLIAAAVLPSGWRYLSAMGRGPSEFRAR